MHVNQARLILGVPVHASVEEIQSTFYQRAKDTHPDSTGKLNASEFIRLRAAYEELIKTLGKMDKPTVTVGDFQWEWTLRAYEIRTAFARMREEFKRLQLSDTLLSQLAVKIRSYQTADAMRQRIKDDAQAIAKKFIAEIEARLRHRKDWVLRVFNYKLEGMYSALYTQVRREQRKEILYTSAFRNAFCGFAAVISPGLVFQAGLGIVWALFCSLPLSIIGGYGIAQLRVRHRQENAIMRLEPKGLTAFASRQRAPELMTEAEGDQGGIDPITLDFLLDGASGIFSVIGVAAEALSRPGAPSVSQIQEQAVAELDAHIKTHLQLEQRLEDYLHTEEERVLKHAHQVYLRNRRQAIDVVCRYPLLEKKVMLARESGAIEAEQA